MSTSRSSASRSGQISPAPREGAGQFCFRWIASNPAQEPLEAPPVRFLRVRLTWALRALQPSWTPSCALALTTEAVSIRYVAELIGNTDAPLFHRTAIPTESGAPAAAAVKAKKWRGIGMTRTPRPLS
jgi:hypothetical protein